MGEVITLAERRARRRPDAAAGDAGARRVLLRPRVPVHVPGGRARRPRVRRRRPGRRPARARCAAARCRPTEREVGAIMRAGRGARRRAAAAAGVARALPGRCRPRCASRTTPPSRAAARAFVLAATPARVLRRLRPRRPGDPGRGGGRRGPRLDDCLRAARDDAPRRRDRGGRRGACSARAPTGCRRCASGARCSGARSASATPPRRARHAAPPALRAPRAERRAYGRDEPGEDLRVDRLARLAALSASRGAAQDRLVAVGLGEQQVEVGVGSAARFGHRRSSVARPCPRR